MCYSKSDQNIPTKVNVTFRQKVKMTYVQSTARVRRFCRGLWTSPAPTGQDEGSWRTWWGHRPHGRAENKNTKSRRFNKRVWKQTKFLNGFWHKSSLSVVSCGLVHYRHLAEAPVLADVLDNTLLPLTWVKATGTSTRIIWFRWATGALN